MAPSKQRTWLLGDKGPQQGGQGTAGHAEAPYLSGKQSVALPSTLALSTWVCPGLTSSCPCLQFSA